jgi:hypothetical protein
VDKAERNKVYKAIVEKPDVLDKNLRSMNLSEKDLLKHTIVEKVPFSLDIYLNSGQINQATDSYMVVYYEPKSGQSSIYSLCI